MVSISDLSRRPWDLLRYKRRPGPWLLYAAMVENTMAGRRPGGARRRVGAAHPAGRLAPGPVWRPEGRQTPPRPPRAYGQPREHAAQKPSHGGAKREKGFRPGLGACI